MAHVIADVFPWRGHEGDIHSPQLIFQREYKAGRALCLTEYMQQVSQPADLGAYSTLSMAMTKHGQFLASDIVLLDEG